MHVFSCYNFESSDQVIIDPFPLRQINGEIFYFIYRCSFKFFLFVDCGISDASVFRVIVEFKPKFLF